jgi:predicted Rdx family selenoprotein
VKAWLESRSRGPVELRTGKSGQFDIEFDGRLAYSRYATGRFPQETDLEKLGNA